MSKRKTASQFNARLPRHTHLQINELSEVHGLTKTQVIILAVDRLALDLLAESAQARRGVKRLKTTARVIPALDLGQED